MGIVGFKQKNENTTIIDTSSTKINNNNNDSDDICGNNSSIDDNICDSDLSNNRKRKREIAENMNLTKNELIQENINSPPKKKKLNMENICRENEILRKRINILTENNLKLHVENTKLRKSIENNESIELKKNTLKNIDAVNEVCLPYYETGNCTDSYCRLLHLDQSQSQEEPEINVFQNNEENESDDIFSTLEDSMEKDDREIIMKGVDDASLSEEGNEFFMYDDC